MRPIRVRLSAAGTTPWIQLDRNVAAFSVGIRVVLSSGASMTYSVQHTFDDIHNMVPVSVTRSGTAATLKYTNHGLSVGDSVVVISAGTTNLEGTFPVASVVDANNVTYTVSNTGPTTDGGNTLASLLRVSENIILTGVTTSGDTNYSAPVEAVRLKISTYVSGFADILILQGLM